MESTSGKVFITDCEGPITKNDNAAELAEAFIPDGDKFFAKISLYDDYLAEIAHRPDYKAGDTLRLILPFFKAFSIDHASMTGFSRRNIDIIPCADSVLRGISERVPSYIVSTSYSPYVQAVCDAIRFPFENTFNTQVDLDTYHLPNTEKAMLKAIHATILELPEFTIPSDAASPADLTEKDRETINRLDEIFWSDLTKMEIYRIVEEVNPIGGSEKARAIETIVAKEQVDLKNVIYIGDSITDVDAFRLVKASGGIAVSFNGNNWAVKEASFAIVAQNALPIGWLATLFIEEGHSGFDNLMIDAITQENTDTIARMSSRVRKDVRTETIGSLG